jgi:hypothetical protein
MVSDALNDACERIRGYLDDPIYAEMYSSKLREEIRRVLAEMEGLCVILDAPPAMGPPDQ